MVLTSPGRLTSVPEVTRSKPSNALAMLQPSLIFPTRFFLGTRTLSKKVSQKEAPPSIWRIGRTEIPGDFFSISRKLIPCCFCPLVSVRTRAKIQFAESARDVRVFCPLTTESSPSASARVCSEARSDPASGSE